MDGGGKNAEGGGFDDAISPYCVSAIFRGVSRRGGNKLAIKVSNRDWNELMNKLIDQQDTLLILRWKESQYLKNYKAHKDKRYGFGEPEHSPFQQAPG